MDTIPFKTRQLVVKTLSAPQFHWSIIFRVKFGYGGYCQQYYNAHEAFKRWKKRNPAYVIKGDRIVRAGYDSFVRYLSKRVQKYSDNPEDIIVSFKTILSEVFYDGWEEEVQESEKYHLVCDRLDELWWDLYANFDHDTIPENHVQSCHVKMVKDAVIDVLCGRH